MRSCLRVFAVVPVPGPAVPLGCTPGRVSSSVVRMAILVTRFRLPRHLAKLYETYRSFS